jgi:hypothetical protein
MTILLYQTPLSRRALRENRPNVESVPHQVRAAAHQEVLLEAGEAEEEAEVGEDLGVRFMKTAKL